MLLCNCKAKIKKMSTAFAIALLSARLEQTVCYKKAAVHSLHNDCVSADLAYIIALNKEVPTFLFSLT
jgi:hypothetical protein